MNWVLATGALASLGGAGIMYFLDPNGGRSRRALAQEKARQMADQIEPLVIAASNLVGQSQGQSKQWQVWPTMLPRLVRRTPFSANLTPTSPLSLLVEGFVLLVALYRGGGLARMALVRPPLQAVSEPPRV